jgi:hypothetical protein
VPQVDVSAQEAAKLLVDASRQRRAHMGDGEPDEPVQRKPVRVKSALRTDANAPGGVEAHL